MKKRKRMEMRKLRKNSAEGSSLARDVEENTEGSSLARDVEENTVDDAWKRTDTGPGGEEQPESPGTGVLAGAAPAQPPAPGSSAKKGGAGETKKDIEFSCNVPEDLTQLVHLHEPAVLESLSG